MEEPVSPSSADEKRKRKRKRVSKACDSCRKAKTSCSDYRPCARCIRLDIADSCNDFEQHSKAQATDKVIWKRLLSSLQEASSSEQLENSISTLMSPNAMLKIPFQKCSTSHGNNLEIDQLRKENNELTQQLLNALEKVHQLSSEKHSYYFFSLISNPGKMATSVWSFPNTVLLDSNSVFSDMAGKSARPGNNFSCKMLFREHHVQRCVRIISFLSTRTVYSLIVPQKWVVNGTEKDMLSMVRLVFDESGCPIQIIMLSSEGTPSPEEELFVPKNVKYIENNWNNSSQASTSPSDSNSWTSPYITDSPHQNSPIQHSPPQNSPTSIGGFTSLLNNSIDGKSQNPFDSNALSNLQIPDQSYEQFLNQTYYPNQTINSYSNSAKRESSEQSCVPLQSFSSSGFLYNNDFASF